MGKYMTSIWFKISNSKILYLNFCRFFKQSVSKIVEKTCIWTILCFLPLSSLNNVEEQKAKLAPSNVIGSEHFLGGDGEF